MKYYLNTLDGSFQAFSDDFEYTPANNEILIDYEQILQRPDNSTPVIKNGEFISWEISAELEQKANDQNEQKDNFDYFNELKTLAIQDIGSDKITIDELQEIWLLASVLEHAYNNQIEVKSQKIIQLFSQASAFSDNKEQKNEIKKPGK